MPMDLSKYPPDWNKIASRIKAAVRYICQDCGMQCRLPGEPFDTHRRTMSVHHVGAPKADGSPGDPHDKMDVRVENLLALCTSCGAQMVWTRTERNAAMPHWVDCPKRDQHRRK